MDNDTKIAQVIAMIPNITDEQLGALGTSAAISEDEMAQAHGNYGFEADRRSSIISLDVPFPILEMAHQTILGILSGQEGLTQTWRDVFGEFKGAPGEAVETPIEPELPEVLTEPTETPVEEELPVESTEPVETLPAEEVPVETPNIQDGAI